MKLGNLSSVLVNAVKNGYGVGSFSPRSTFLIEPVLKAAQSCNSPIIIQMSANEFNWFDVTAKEFAEAFYRAKDLVDIPAVLHLDHTKDIEVIKQAIEAGFTSVMIDASHLPYEENIALSKEVVALAHPRGVSVEAELGSIGGADKLETGSDTTLFTDPKQAKDFIERTGVDALAVSVGTAHGVYLVKNPTIDFDRLKAIRQLTDTPLVLHGGSGLSTEVIERAINLDGIGGVSKINIATDLEIAFLAAMKGRSRMTNAQINELPTEELQAGGEAVMRVVEEKIRNYVHSQNRA